MSNLLISIQFIGDSPFIKNVNLSFSPPSVFDVEESVESEEATEKLASTSKDVYLNDTLTFNMTSMETHQTHHAESPLPTHLTEIDKILRAGLSTLIIYSNI